MVKKEKNLTDYQSSLAKDHLANERTFLAWIRTCIGIMAFGFVVEKFALFIKQIAILLGNSDVSTTYEKQLSFQGYPSIFGVFLVALGVLICLLAFIQYKNVQKQIEDVTYHPTILLNVMLTLAVLLIGVFIIIYWKNI